MHNTVKKVTDTIIQRSRAHRSDYLERMHAQLHAGATREKLSCSNLVHGFAAAPENDKLQLKAIQAPNIGIVSAYNDMLSAHQPLQQYPEIIKQSAREHGCTAQFAGGVPAMCDGVTQGQPGMELSLFSRDTIAMSTAIALSHNMFDAAICMGVCDKIVPGLLIGAMSFGHLPVALCPAGPMTTGISNKEKAWAREQFAQGKISRAQLLEWESKSYHGPGTCTFYGTANSNQMLVEIMGLHLPGSSFINPDNPLRRLLIQETTRVLANAATKKDPQLKLCHILDERSIVNAMVGLLATGGSTNHTIHLVAIARSAGILINWDDFAQLSTCVPLVARVYPNGEADINQFHAAGGMSFLMRTLLDAGLLHADARTITGKPLHSYTLEPWIDQNQLAWREGATDSLDDSILRPCRQPFSQEGGLKVLQGELGRAIVKISSVDADHRFIQAPAIVFPDQISVRDAFERGELNRDFVAVLPFQGPRANGMPELHKLTPLLSTLQKKGYRVAILTDGRMSGASGTVLAAIHVCPEAIAGGQISKITTGDLVTIDSEHGMLTFEPQAGTDSPAIEAPNSADSNGTGRELFGHMRACVSGAEEGASVFFNGS